ncbi:succinate dehydrogenase cytochrome b558 subunit [Paenibacillus aurantius]|uniref:Succinate dehydrogenase cytochrome b558 subunit n=1 Tax=Paenibacillus aurantius TaxID=2918900 RepID=A0AA96REN7_9BACL|nr:succinate dehydrogenase cytochrome b558 subunit [Paenibacillus aurantius]WJH32274.1 succinate dehydrogenase cytochrome b558 subunit [Paenibacillus sp. CC-CFT747]WNQ12655.1 succinate dehydrogenase cytochrome b558 subunit [Paenibacillus aurantius]
MRANSYHYRKIHSLLGVIPIGFFLIEHLLTNYTAFKEGHQGFVDQINWLNSLPLVLALEIFGIYLPLLYHGVYGLYVAYTARNNVTNYGYFRNLMFTLQRITGVITFLFIAWHIFETRIQVALGNVAHEDLGVRMHEIATQPIVFALYVIGIVAASFHFANGMWSFLVAWGITIGPRAQRVSSYVWMGVFVVMAVMFVLSLSAFTGTEFQDTASIKHG